MLKLIAYYDINSLTVTFDHYNYYNNNDDDDEKDGILFTIKIVPVKKQCLFPSL